MNLSDYVGTGVTSPRHEYVIYGMCDLWVGHEQQIRLY